MNRYTDLSVSAYTPQSMGELAFTPMMKRQKHDAAQVKLDAYLTDINKIDPLDVHTPEAMQIKADLSNKVNQQAELLAREGFTNNTIPNVLSTNREIQDLYSPTGRAGQINAAKIVEAKERKDFMDSAEKQGIGSSRAVELWRDHLSQYKGYDDQNRIKNIDPRGVAAKQDYETDLLQYHSILGKTTESAKASGYHFEDGPNGTVMVDAKGNKVTSDNFKQLQDAQKGFETKWINPNGEGYKYSQDAGLNITPNKVKNDFNAMKESSSIDNRYNDVQFIRDPKAKDAKTLVEGESNQYPLDTIPVSSNQNMLDALNNNGKENWYDKKTNVTGIFGTEKIDTTYPTIKSMIKTPEYIKLAASIVKSNSSLKGLKYNSDKVLTAVKNYLENNKDYSRDNAFVSPNKEQDSSLFEDASDRTSDADRDATLKTRVSSRSAQMYNTKTGKPLDESDLSSMKDIHYQGYMTNKSIVNMIGVNTKQKIMPILATYTDSEGKSQQVYVTRNPNDQQKPFFKAAEISREIGNVVDHQPDIYHLIKNSELEAMGLKNIEVKRDKQDGSYKINADVKVNGKYVKHPFYFHDETELNKWVYNAYNTPTN